MRESLAKLVRRWMCECVHATISDTSPNPVGEQVDSTVSDLIGRIVERSRPSLEIFVLEVVEAVKGEIEALQKGSAGADSGSHAQPPAPDALPIARETDANSCSTRASSPETESSPQVPPAGSNSPASSTSPGPCSDAQGTDLLTARSSPAVESGSPGPPVYAPTPPHSTALSASRSAAPGVRAAARESRGSSTRSAAVAESTQPSPKSVPTPVPQTKVTPTLERSDLGNNLLSSLKTRLQEKSVKFHVSGVEISRGALLDAVPEDEDDVGFAAQFEVQHAEEGGTWHLYQNEANDFTLPVFSAVERPSEEPENFLDELQHNMPMEPVSYWVGPLLGPEAEKLQSLFPSGDGVRELGGGAWAGLRTLYGHVGGEGSGTAFHCEDAELRSYNVTLMGWKIWILIDPQHTEAFEELVRKRTGGTSNCDQWVRHRSVMFSPLELKKAEIKFEVVQAGPGDMVVTRPRQYHSVVNCTPSFAVSTNFVLPGEKPITRKITVCGECGLKDLDHEMIQPLRKGKRKADEGSQGPTGFTTHSLPLTKRPKVEKKPAQDQESRARAGPATQVDAATDLDEAALIFAQQPAQDQETRARAGPATQVDAATDLDEPALILAQQPAQDQETRARAGPHSQLDEAPDLDKAAVLAEESVDTRAILRFMALVSRWRGMTDEELKWGAQSLKTDSTLAGLDRLREWAYASSEVFLLLGVLTEVRMAREGYNTKAGRRSTKAIDGLVLGRKLELNKENRRTIHNDLSGWQKWNFLCGTAPEYPREGILAFLPAVYHECKKASPRTVRRFNKSHTELFHSTLDGFEHVERLCEVGKAFQDAVWARVVGTNVEFANREFESWTLTELGKLARDELVKLL